MAAFRHLQGNKSRKEINLDPREQVREVCKAHDRVARTSSGRLVGIEYGQTAVFQKEARQGGGQVSREEAL
jgi:hypothetical protein